MSDNENRVCDCGSDNLIDLGFIPAQVVTGVEYDIAFCDTWLCEECGSFTVREVDEEDIEQAEEQYVQALIDRDLIEEDRVDEVL
jgi:hypothetical protein